MRLIFITAIVLLYSSGSIAQSNGKQFVYGTLKGPTSFTGYFWFDNVLTQMGQRIWYKESLETKKKKTLYAETFETFQNDTLFLRTFKTIPYGTGRLAAMTPRIVSGKLELYNALYRGYYAFEKSDHFYIYDGKKKFRLVKRKFKEQMKELLADDADILQRIEREEVGYDDLPAIIYNYNLRQKTGNETVERLEE